MVSFLLEYKPPEGRDFCLFCSLLYSQHLRIVLGTSSISSDIIQISEFFNRKVLFELNYRTQENYHVYTGQLLVRCSFKNGESV